MPSGIKPINCVGKKGRSGRKSRSEEHKVVLSVIEQMEEVRQRALTLLAEKEDKAGYRDLIDAADKMTKNIQLLGGKATENVRTEVIFKDAGNNNN